MNLPFKTLLIATTFATGLGSVAQAQMYAPMKSVLQPVRQYDVSAEARAAVAHNLDVLGIELRQGDTLSVEELFAIQRIINDQSSLQSKAFRIERITGTGPFDDPGDGRIIFE